MAQGRDRLWVRQPARLMGARQLRASMLCCSCHLRLHATLKTATNEYTLNEPMADPPAQFLMWGMIMCRMMMRTCWCSSVCGQQMDGEWLERQVHRRNISNVLGGCPGSAGNDWRCTRTAAFHAHHASTIAMPLWSLSYNTHVHVSEARLRIGRRKCRAVQCGRAVRGQQANRLQMGARGRA